MTKIGLVVSGGGNRSGGAVGALHAWFVENGVAPCVLVAVSGGVELSLRCLLGRFASMYEWPRLFANWRYVCIWRFWRMMNIDVLVDKIMGPQEPDLYEKAAESSTRICIATTNVLTGLVKWHHNEDLVLHGRKIKKASCAIPGIYGKVIIIDGIPHVDGSFSVSLADCIQKAFGEGADKVVVIDTENTGARWKTGLLLQVLSWRQGKKVRAIVRAFVKRKEEPIQNSDRVIVCRPQLSIRHALDTNTKRLAKGIAEGYAAMASLRIN